jgi:heme/copper-type cytochrome/quinol oxidase subunit 2
VTNDDLPASGWTAGTARHHRGEDAHVDLMIIIAIVVLVVLAIALALAVVQRRRRKGGVIASGKDGTA